MLGTTGPSPACRVCTWVWATLNGGVTVTRGAAVSVDPVTATLPVVPARVHSGGPPFCGAVVGHAPAVAMMVGRVKTSAGAGVLADEVDDVFVGEPQAVEARTTDAAQARSVTAEDRREEFTVATVQTPRAAGAVGPFDSPKNCDEEVGVVAEGAQIPAGQQHIRRESGRCRIVEKLIELIAATGAEADNRPGAVGEVGSQVGQHCDPGAGRKKGHDVAGGQDGVERFGDAAGGQVEVRQVTDQPLWAGMVSFGGLDEHRVDVDADNLMAHRRQIPAQPAGATSGVKDPRSARHHGVDEAGFADQILTSACH